MNRRRLLVIGTLAACLGGLASWHVYRSLGEKIASSKQVGVDVLVAAHDIGAGARIDERDLQVVNYPVESLPQSVLHSKEKALGHLALLPVAKGDFVLPSKIADGSGNHLTARIPVGMRAIQVPVTEFESSLFTSGERVDVLVTGNAAASNETQTRTVLVNVPVLEKVSRTVMLVVSPEDAQRLTLASQEGRVKLTLRNPADASQQNTPAVTKTTLYGGQSGSKVRRIPSAIPPAPKYYEIQVIHGTQPVDTQKFKQ
jgi:pilus assembly protein CpaB